MILEGWPETSPPPRGASKTYADQQQTTWGGADEVGNEMKWNKKRRLEGRRVTIIIGELGFSSDLNPQKTVERKQHKYGPLIEELVREGWDVDPTVHVITVGVRATVPTRNIEVPWRSLGSEISRRSRKSSRAWRE